MQQDFSKQLIKGKVAEMIFDQMFRKVRDFTVIPFGYEAIIPELMQYTERGQSRELIDNIRNAPDFALVSHDPKQVMLVEVKYRSNPNPLEVAKHAGEICDKWKLVWMFLATPSQFYFFPCNEFQEKLQLVPLSTFLIPQEIQDEYLGLLNEFIPKV